MDLHDGYIPNTWQTSFHASNARHKCCAGGLGCLAEDSKVLTSRGFQPISELKLGTPVVSYSSRGFELSLSTHGFPKGKANLYRVIHEQGQFVAAGHHLVFCADHKYRRVDEIDALRKTNSFCGFLPVTTEESSLLKFLEDARHLRRTLANSLDRYLSYSRRCDQRPHSLITFFQEFFPSLVGAQEIFQSPYLAPELSHIRHDQSRVRWSTQDYILQWVVPALAWELKNSLSKSFEHAWQKLQNVLQSPKTLESHQTSEQSQVDTSSRKTPFLEIERLPHEEWYWDVQVPDTHNYVAGGAVHHNSGKTFAACMELRQCALESPGSVWVVGRKLLPALKDSVWRDLLSVLPSEIVKSYNKTAMIITLRNGSEFWGRPLYDAEIFKSYQISGFMIEEANEVDKEIYDRLKDRMRQMLPNRTRPRYQSILCLNPTEEDHWIPQLFLTQKPLNHELFQSSTFQNKENLPVEYIEELSQIYSPDVLERLLHGHFGRVHKGRPVFPQFKLEYHVKPVAFNPELPLIRGWDFGYNNPACVWMQIQHRQIRVLAEVLGKKVYLDRFIEDHVLPLEKQLFGRDVATYVDFCDPHGADETDKGISSVKILNEHLIFPTYRKQFIEPGINAINFHLDTIDGGTKLSNFLIHPRCRLLVDALKGGYHRLEGENKPEKDGLYDHLMDAMRYAIFMISLRLKTNEMQRAQSNLQVFVDPMTGRRIEGRAQ